MPVMAGRRGGGMLGWRRVCESLDLEGLEICAWICMCMKMVFGCTADSRACVPRDMDGPMVNVCVLRKCRCGRNADRTQLKFVFLDHRACFDNHHFQRRVHCMTMVVSL